MKKVISVLSQIAAIFSGNCIAQESVTFSASFKVDDSLNHLVQHELNLDEKRIVDFDERYSFEFTAPSEINENSRVVIKLLERDGDGYKVIHSSKQNLPNMKIRHVGYQMCNGNLKFLSPAPEFLPACVSKVDA